MRRLAFLLPFAIVTADQLSKLAALTLLAPGESLRVIGRFVQLTLVFNTGGAFSVLADQPVVFVVVPFAVTLVLAAYAYLHREHPGLRTALFVVIGGALGNLLDRVFRESVVDFIDVRVWPIFNLADVAVVTGLALFAYHTLRREKGASEARQERQSEPEGEG